MFLLALGTSVLTVFGYKYTPLKNSIYVSIQGGQNLENGLIGYNNYQYCSHFGQSDTLILSGKGYETDLVPMNVNRFYEEFNESIQHVRENVILKKNNNLFCDTIELHGRMVKIDYLNTQCNEKIEFKVTILKTGKRRG